MRRPFRIELQPAFWAMLCAYFYFDPAGTFFPFCLSAALHEAGHLLCLHALGVRVRSLRLSCCGAVLSIAPLTYGKELVAAASGPCVNLVLFFLCLRPYPLTALVNLCLFAYNMLPLYPLDGGRILRAALHLLLSDAAAVQAERWVSRLCIAALGAAAAYASCVLRLGLWPVLVFALLLVRIGGSVRATPPVRA